MRTKHAALIGLIALIMAGSTGCLPLDMLEGSLSAPAVVEQFVHGWKYFDQSDLYDAVSANGVWDEMYIGGNYNGGQYYSRTEAAGFYGDPSAWPWDEYADCLFEIGKVSVAGRHAEVQAMIETVDYDGTRSTYANLVFTVEQFSDRWVITGIRWVY